METKDTFLDSFTESYTHCDFFVCEKQSVQDDRLKEFEKNASPYPPIDILTFHYNKLKLEDHMKII